MFNFSKFFNDMKQNCSNDIKKYYLDDTNDKERNYHNVVSNYIKFYHCRAKLNRFLFYIMSIIKIILLTSIPFLQIKSNLSPEWATGASSISLALEGIIALTRVQDKWQLYRSTNNSLMQEQREYMTKTGKYSASTDNVFTLYVQNIENIINNEGKKWSSTVKDSKQESNEQEPKKKDNN